MNQSKNNTKPKIKITKQQENKNRFSIDFFEFSFLVEACIAPRTIARASFWNDLIDKHYHILTPNERERLFEWINRNGNFEHNLKDNNEDCLLFNARFDKDNQYQVKANYNNQITTYDCFKWKDRYHTAISISINEDYIIEVLKLSEKTEHLCSMAGKGFCPYEYDKGKCNVEGKCTNHIK